MDSDAGARTEKEKDEACARAADRGVGCEKELPALPGGARKGAGVEVPSYYDDTSDEEEWGVVGGAGMSTRRIEFSRKMS